MEVSDIDRLYAEGLAHGRQGVVGAVVVGPDGRVFAQRRSPHRKTFPGCWDLVGGHVEPGETPLQALGREVFEETGWTVDRVLAVLKMVDWESPGPGGPSLKREFVLAVSITGGWDSPRLESGKVTEGRWFGADELAVLHENRDGTDAYVYDCAAAWYAWLRATKT